MKIGNIIKLCKIHNRETEHGIYSYSKNEKSYSSSRCLECVRENRAERRKDPQINDHDKKYCRMWSKINREELSKKRREKDKINYLQKISAVDKFLLNYNKEILSVLSIFESDYTFDNIKKWSYRYGITSIDDVINHVKRRKFSRLKDQKAWSISSLKKYQLGVRENYPEIPERKKENIRSQYKKEAFKKASQKIKELESNLSQHLKV
jgi:hypothetical protein